jgi:NAD+ synthase
MKLPQDTPALSRYLRIDEERTVERFVDYLQDLSKKTATNGVLIGLSGGIDSSVLSTLAVNALGKDSVHLEYLYDQHSGHELRHNAQLMSEWLGIELLERSIEPAMRELAVYAPFGMMATSFSGLLNRFLHQMYRFVFRETPFISSLRLGSAEASEENLSQQSFRKIIRQPETGLNVRHQYRRQILEEKAHERNWLLLGAANRTEWLVGWFVKDGIDDLPIQPLIGLYKTQVRQIATYVKIPAEVQDQAPSPDMMGGITDEFALGLSYSRIDLILEHLDGGLTKEMLLNTDFSDREICLVGEMNRLSQWKRGQAHTHFPVDGGLDGGLRLQNTDFSSQMSVVRYLRSEY